MCPANSILSPAESPPQHHHAVDEFGMHHPAMWTDTCCVHITPAGLGSQLSSQGLVQGPTGHEDAPEVPGLPPPPYHSQDHGFITALLWQPQSWAVAWLADLVTAMALLVHQEQAAQGGHKGLREELGGHCCLGGRTL